MVGILRKTVSWKEPLVQVLEIPKDGHARSLEEARLEHQRMKTAIKRQQEIKGLRDHFTRHGKGKITLWSTPHGLLRFVESMCFSCDF